MASYVFDWISWLDSSGTETSSNIAVDASRNVYVTGSNDATSSFITLSGITYPKPNGATAAGYTFQLTASGDYLNNKWIDGAGVEYCNTGVIDSSRNIIIGGYSDATSTTTFNVGGTTITKINASTGVGIIAKFNSAFTYQFPILIDGLGDDQLYKCATGTNNDIVGIGNTSGNASITISGATGTRVTGTKPLSGITTNRSCWIIRSSGVGLISNTVQWIDSSGTNHVPVALIMDSNNFATVVVTIQSCPTQVYIGGTLRTKTGTGSTVGVVARYNTTNAFTSHQFIDSSGGSVNILGIRQDNLNSTYVFGYVDSATHMTISGINYPIQYPFGSTGFIIKYTANTTYQWHQFIYSAASTSLISATMTVSGTYGYSQDNCIVFPSSAIN
jgi:hypothetical protein